MGGHDQGLCILGEDSKGVESLVVHCPMLLKPDQSQLHSLDRAKPCFPCTSLDDMCTNEGADNQEQCPGGGAWKCVALNGVSVIKNGIEVVGGETSVDKDTNLENNTDRRNDVELSSAYFVVDVEG